MAHWAEYLTRGILTLLSFSNLGTGIRCFIDQEFVIHKLFQSQTSDNAFAHLFGVYSLLSCLIYSQSSIYIFVYPLTRLVYGCIISYLSLFLLQIYYYKTITLNSSTCFPLFMNAAILIWLSIFYIWKPYRLDINDPEKETFLKHGLPFLKTTLKPKKKNKTN